jgi:hypothetical protein
VSFDRRRGFLPGQQRSGDAMKVDRVWYSGPRLPAGSRANRQNGSNGTNVVTSIEEQPGGASTPLSSFAEPDETNNHGRSGSPLWADA